jgi:hypothetical protein
MKCCPAAWDKRVGRPQGQKGDDYDESRESGSMVEDTFGPSILGMHGKRKEN